MANLIGFAHQSGTIVFGRRENPWAFRRMDDEMRTEQQNRVKFDPSLAPVVIEPSPNCDVGELPWLDDVRRLLESAQFVFLQRNEDLLRFRRAVHQIDPQKLLITLGTQTELEHFAAEHWTKLSHFYASRRDGFRFDIEKVVARDKDQQQPFEPLEIHGRLGAHPESGEMMVTFDATGSNAPLDVISWRSTVADGESGRFAPANARISLSISNFKQPYTFCQEYHDDFKSNWFLFDPTTVRSWTERANKRSATKS
jgi:hypothetical protein